MAITINSSMENKSPIYQVVVPIDEPEMRRKAINLFLWQPEKVALGVLGVFPYWA